jgi:hypothetical protein
MTPRILAASIATMIGAGYLALALTDHDTAVVLMPVVIAITLLLIGFEAATRYRR